MTEYLIAANEEWVPDYSEERMQEMSQAVKALRAEMKAAGVYVFLGGLDNSAPVFNVDATSGSPVFTDGPYTETKEHLGGFTIIDVPDEEAARLWAQRLQRPACGPTRCAAFKSHGSPPKARWGLLARRSWAVGRSPAHACGLRRSRVVERRRVRQPDHSPFRGNEPRDSLTPRLLACVVK
jgi:hypothetical protein